MHMPRALKTVQMLGVRNSFYNNVLILNNRVVAQNRVGHALFSLDISTIFSGRFHNCYAAIQSRSFA